MLGSNLMFVTQNLQNRRQYAVAIRGTIETFSSIVEDIEVFSQVPLPWQSSGDKLISQGIARGVTNLIEVKEPATGFTLEAFLRQIPAGSEIFVTGHSQGGAVASVMAVYIDTICPRLIVYPYTFAAQTAGNQAFKTNFEQRFQGRRGGRYVNPFDVVPLAFAGLEQIKTIYIPEPPGIEISYLYEGLLNTLIDGLKRAGVSYVQPGNPVKLLGKLIPVRDIHFYNRNTRFDQEIEVQHSHFTYLSLLGAPLTPDVPQTPWPPASIPFAKTVSDVDRLIQSGR